jgi:phage terminase large subunit-like protein
MPLPKRNSSRDARSRAAPDGIGAGEDRESEAEPETSAEAETEAVDFATLAASRGVSPDFLIREGLKGRRQRDLLTRFLHLLRHDPKFTLRLKQQPPDGDWRSWILIGGRGSGKTRAGAEWVHQLAMTSRQSELRIALIGETLGDAREVMVDGVSGICRIAKRCRPSFEASRRRLVWPNGAVAQIFSSEDPESLRGPQFHCAWADELGKWAYPQETWDMLQFGLRLGEQPRQMVTTTPRAMPLLKSLMAERDSVVAVMPTLDNANNLPAGFIAALDKRYGGTRLGRQELDGELIEDREDSLWSRAMFEAGRLDEAPDLTRIVVAVDPPSGSGPTSTCGVVVAGKALDGKIVILEDASLSGASPAGWAKAVVAAFRMHLADRVVAEVNQGGDMVAAMLRSINVDLPITMVRATRGKYLRAEPVAALYEQGRVAHFGRMDALEAQMLNFGPDGLSQGRSPDRLDALVWAVTAMSADGLNEPRVRGI